MNKGVCTNCGGRGFTELEHGLVRVFCGCEKGDALRAEMTGITIVPDTEGTVKSEPIVINGALVTFEDCKFATPPSTEGTVSSEVNPYEDDFQALVDIPKNFADKARGGNDSDDSLFCRETFGEEPTSELKQEMVITDKGDGVAKITLEIAEVTNDGIIGTGQTYTDNGSTPKSRKRRKRKGS